MTFERRDGADWIFRLKSKEHELLLSVLGLREQFPRRSSPISRDPDTATELLEAGEDLNSSLTAHRESVAKSVDQMLKDPARCRAIQGGCELLMDSDQVHALLQALNEVRIGAWEKLGCPDFESAMKPKISSKGVVSLWVLQLTALFQGRLLAALEHDPS